MKQKAMLELIRRIIKRNRFRIFLVLYLIIGAVAFPIIMKLNEPAAIIFFAVIGEFMFLLALGLIVTIYELIKRLKSIVLDWKKELIEIEKKQQK